MYKTREAWPRAVGMERGHSYKCKEASHFHTPVLSLTEEWKYKRRSDDRQRGEMARPGHFMFALLSVCQHEELPPVYLMLILIIKIIICQFHTSFNLAILVPKTQEEGGPQCRRALAAAGSSRCHQDG